MFRVEKMDLLIGVYIFCVAAAELMGSKTIPLVQLGSWMFSVSVAVFTLPILFTINDVVSEVHGRQRAKSVALVGVCVVFLIACFSGLAVALPPSARFVLKNEAYTQVFKASLRFSAASLVAFLCAEFLDIFVFARMRERWGANKLWLRTNLSNILAQGLDTFIFMVLAFWNVGQGMRENVVFLLGLILPYWFIKCVFSFLETPFVYWGVRWLKP